LSGCRRLKGLFELKRVITAHPLLILVRKHAAMKFCDAAECPSCPLAGNTPACLRNKAQFCMRLAQMSCADGIRGPLEKMSLYLMQEADALENETTALAKATDRSPSSPENTHPIVLRAAVS
jgi:hypothetical protein